MIRKNTVKNRISPLNKLKKIIIQAMPHDTDDEKSSPAVVMLNRYSAMAIPNPPATIAMSKDQAKKKSLARTSQAQGALGPPA